MIGKKKKSKAAVLDEYSEDSYSTDSQTDDYADTSTEQDPYADDYSDDDSYSTTTTAKKKKKKSSSGALTGIVFVVAAVAIILVAVFVISSLIGPTKSQCENTIATTQESLRELDVKKFCTVIDPTIGRKILALATVADSLTDTDPTEMLENGISQLGGDFLPDDGTPVADALEKIEIEPYSYGLPGTSRTVKCKIKYDGNVYANVKFVMKKKDGDTYISKVSLIE